MTFNRQSSLIVLFLFLVFASFSACGGEETGSNSSAINVAEKSKENLSVDKVKEEAPIPEPVPEKDLRSKWQGKLDDKIPVTLELQMEEGMAYGTLVYDKVGTPIRLIGLEEGTDNYRVLEMGDQGSISGVWNLGFKGAEVTGYCWFPASKKSMNFKLKAAGTGAEVEDLSTETFTGDFSYSYGDEANNGSLNVIGFEEGNVQFNLTCLTAAPAYHIAALEELELTLMGNKLEFRESEYGECAFDIRFYKDFVVINYIDDKRDCGFGHNAFVDGIYLRE